MKTCKQCGEAKPLTDFYANRAVCKPCVRARVREHRRENDSVREYDRARAKAPERRAHVRRVVIDWRATHPDKYRAQTAVGNALRDGKIKKLPCEVCGAKKVHAHHHDYSKPLDVTWLCPLHHHRLHAEDNGSKYNTL